MHKSAVFVRLIKCSLLPRRTQRKLCFAANACWEVKEKEEAQTADLNRTVVWGFGYTA